MNAEDCIDTAALDRLRHLGEDKLVKEMIELYLDYAPKMLHSALAGEQSGDCLPIEKAAHSRAPVNCPAIHGTGPRGLGQVDLEVIPLRQSGEREQFFLVLFHELQRKGAASKEERPAKNATRGSEKAAHRENQWLKQELKATNQYLQSIIEEQEATNEEIRSANEEIQSSNEELQSTNEELETAKEELQSSNEELTTVNEELQNRNIELTHANNDLNNLLNNINIPIVMLCPDLLIRRITPQAETVLNLIPTDIGRPLTDLKLNFEIPNLEQLVREVIDSLKTHEQDVRDRHRHW